MSTTAEPRVRQVLVVDGDYRSSQRLADLLREDGFDVEVVRDGAAAIARLTRAPLPDALITELKLPLADGAAVARFGPTQHAGLRVVVVTRYPNLFLPEAFGNPVPEVLSKPLEYERLLEILGKSASGPELKAAVAFR
jgi:DNA-binding NtrC family response regulator